MKKFLKTFSCLSSLAILLFPAPVFADLIVGVPIGGETKFTGYGGYISAVFTFSLQLGSALAILMVIYAGYKYMTSQGNPSAINEAKDIIIGSLSGLSMLLLIYLILKVLNLPGG